MTAYNPVGYWYEFNFSKEKKTINEELLDTFKCYQQNKLIDSDCNTIFDAIKLIKIYEEDIKEEVESYYYKDLYNLYLRYENGDFDSEEEYKQELKSLEEYYN